MALNGECLRPCPLGGRWHRRGALLVRGVHDPPRPPGGEELRHPVRVRSVGPVDRRAHDRLGTGEHPQQPRLLVRALRSRDERRRLGVSLDDQPRRAQLQPGAGRRYGPPYNTGPLWRQVGSAWVRVFRLALL